MEDGALGCGYAAHGARALIVWELRLGREERGWVACSVVVEGRLVLQLLLLLPPMWVGGEVGQHACGCG